MQNHLVFGAGLIGCYIGGALSSSGIDSQLVCRPSIKQKLLNGIKLTNFLDQNEITAKIRICSKATIFEVIWLTVKCTAVKQACYDLVPYVGKNTVILCCQNGLGSDQIVKTHFPDVAVLRVMVPFNVVELSPGHFHRGSAGSLTLEQANHNSDWVRQLANQLNSPILPVSTSTNMSALLWAKLQLNLGNSINALADMPVQAMLQQRAYRKVIAIMMKELLAVTKAKGIHLPKVTALPAVFIPLVLGLPTFLFKLIANSMLAIDPHVRTSMWWDISLNKPTEIDYLNGAILSEARALGLDCPANRQVVRLIKQLEESQSGARSVLGYPFTGDKLLQIIKQC